MGFGPTQCADYNVGVSIIPIRLLTDADHKWMRTAEYGGTGGQEIVAKMVVEEPDIEIGTGPSSKGGLGVFNNYNSVLILSLAIHRRGGASGRGGCAFGRRGGHPNDTKHCSGYRKPDRQPSSHAPEPHNVGPPPAVPNFGAPIPGFPMNIR